MDILIDLYVKDAWLYAFYSLSYIYKTSSVTKTMRLVCHQSYYFFTWFYVLLKKCKRDKLSHLIALKKLSSEDLNTLILKSLLWRPTVEHCIDSAEFHEANLYLTHSQIEKQSYRETTVNANHLKGNITIHFGATAGVILIRWKGKKKVRNE